MVVRVKASPKALRLACLNKAYPTHWQTCTAMPTRRTSNCRTNGTSPGWALIPACKRRGWALMRLCMVPIDQVQPACTVQTGVVQPPCTEATGAHRRPCTAQINPARQRWRRHKLRRLHPCMGRIRVVLRPCITQTILCAEICIRQTIACLAICITPIWVCRERCTGRTLRAKIH